MVVSVVVQLRGLPRVGASEVETDRLVLDADGLAAEVDGPD
jgi:hypothetical protein